MVNGKWVMWGGELKVVGAYSLMGRGKRLEAGT